MSSTIATAGASSGCLGSARNVVYATNGALWWAFALTATSTLASYSSPDGTTWTARATHSLGMATASEGRDLQVTYKSISGLDVVWFAYVNNASSGANAVDAVRATISGTTITYHTSDTGIGGSAASIATPTYSSGGLELDSNNRAYVVNGMLDANQDTSWTRSTADPGTGEQATAPTWSAVAVIDNSQAFEVKSAYLVSTGSGNMALIADNATAASTWTGLSFYTWNGTTWSGTGGNTSVTGAVTAVDKADWGAVAVSTTDVHVVYRTSTGSWVHRRWNGTSWGAGQTIPAFSTTSGTGVALCSDGTNAWLVAVGSDAANTVKYLKWTAATPAWDAAWTTLESTTQTRTFVSCSRDVGASKIVVLWHQGTSLVSGLISLAAAAVSARPPAAALYAVKRASYIPR